MHRHHRAHRPLAARTLTTALALLGIGGIARADDPNPYYVGVSAGVTHDTNIFRPPPAVDGAPAQPVVGDTYYSLGVLAGIDQPFGRQHLTASGNIKYNRFSHQSDLDNTSFGLNGRLDWEAADRLSGIVSLALNQNLASYGSATVGFTTQKNIETDGQFLARAQYGLVSLVSLYGQYTHQLVHYTADVYKPFSTDEDGLRVGVNYRPSALLTVGTYVQTSHGRYQEGSHLTYNRDDVGVTGTWTPTGQSSFDGRLSYGRQRTEHQSSDDFSGATGQITWNYKPTGKLSFATSLSRDTGFQTGFFNISSTSGAINDISRLATTLSVSSTYAATGKIALNGGVRYSHRSLNNSVESNGTSIPFGQGTDDTQSEYIGATYTPFRSMQFACNIGHDSRTTSASTPQYLSYPYSGNTYGCSAQFTLQ